LLPVDKPAALSLADRWPERKIRQRETLNRAGAW
jgi:hypothetical protein